MGYMVWASMIDCGEPQEIKECATLEEAVLFMRNVEGTSHPDTAYWAEDDWGDEYDSCTELGMYRLHTYMDTPYFFGLFTRRTFPLLGTFDTFNDAASYAHNVCGFETSESFFIHQDQPLEAYLGD